MENPVLADTDVLIDYFNGSPPAAAEVEVLIREERLVLSSVSVFELYAGIIGKKRLQAIDLLIKNALILPLDQQAAKEAGLIFTDLKSRGQLIGNQDILIAAIAQVHALPLLTRNRKHFDRVKGIDFWVIPSKSPEGGSVF